VVASTSTQVIPVRDRPGVSVNSEFVHFQWRARHEDLKTVPSQMLSDIKRELVNATGVLDAEGVADRATFLVDPNNEIQFVSVTAGGDDGSFRLDVELKPPCGWLLLDRSAPAPSRQPADVRPAAAPSGCRRRARTRTPGR